MKHTARNLLFFKAIFNGRVDDHMMTSAAHASAMASTRHADAPKPAVYPTSIGADAAFVFPFGTSCYGGLSCVEDSLTVEGKWSRLLTSDIGAAVSGASATARSNTLAFFDNGSSKTSPHGRHSAALYSVSLPSSISLPNKTVDFGTTASVATVATVPSESTLESVSREAAVFIARLASTAMYDLATTAARHSTSLVEYDQYLCHNQLIQKHLCVIESNRYALDSLAGTVSSDDCALLITFARVALREAVGAANAIFGSMVAQQTQHLGAEKRFFTRRHPSSPATLEINYASLPRAKELLEAISVAAGATDADIGEYALGDLFGKASSHVSDPSASFFARNPLRLSPTHSNVSANVSAVLDELAAFPSTVLKTVDGKSKLQVKKATEIAAELLATVAVLHRSSVAMTNDVDGEGRVQASIGPVFCSLSAARREATSRALTGLKGAARAGSKVVPLDDVSVHPSQF